MTQEVLKLALEALEVLGWQPTEEAMDYRDNAITAIKEALAQTQEPVAWFSPLGNLYKTRFHATANGEQVITPLYTTPQRTWVGLTDDEIDQGLLRSDYAFKTAEAWRAGVVFAMTKLKQKNGFAEEKNT